MDRKNKIEPFYIDDKMLEDPQMDEFLKKSVIEEADKIEKELNSDPSLRNVKAPDDMFEKIKAQLQEQGLWEEDDVSVEEAHIEENSTEENDTEGKAEGTVSGRVTEKEITKEDLYKLLSKEDQEALKLGKKLKKKRKTRWKQFAAAAAAVLVVFSAGMSGEASRRWILDVWDKLILSTGVRVTTDYIEEGNKNISKYNEEEQKAWNEIRAKLNAPTVWLNYLPEGLEFSDYEIISDTREAVLFYSFEDKIFSIRVLAGNTGISFYLQSDAKPLLRENITNDQEILIKIWDTTTKGVESYEGDFEYQDCSFVFSGAFSLEEFEKIIKNFYII